MIGIYKITSPSGRVYIGQSIDIKRRFDQYRRLDAGVSTSTKLYRSLKKYGYKKHKKEIIEECLFDDLNERERYYQDFYNASSADNLNCILTSTKNKKGRARPKTEQEKLAISKVHKGKVLSEETKAKIRKARAKQIITEEHKRKISENSGAARLVINLESGIFYASAKEAAKAHGMVHNQLVCRLINRTRNNTNLKYA